MNQITFRHFMLTFAFILIFPQSVSAELGIFSEAYVTPEPDYLSQQGWLQLPKNPDEHGVDIFWVYPTIFGDDKAWLMDCSSKELIDAAAATIRDQASVFENGANIYAPLYRQMNIKALFLDQDQQDPIAQYGHDDVLRAFRYYLKHHNNGKPFIIAGHSQGSKIMTDIAVEYWGSGLNEEKFIAAYLVGWSITEEDIKKNSNVRMCANASDTGCFIAYNSMAADMQNQSPTLMPGSICTNPLSWRTDTEKAPATLNKGARFLIDGKEAIIPQFTSAQVVDGALVVVPNDKSLVTTKDGLLPEGIYHAFDYALFYENLKANADQRIKAFMNK